MKTSEERKSVQIIVRMNEKLKTDLRQYVNQSGKDMSGVIRESVRERIYKEKK